MANITTTAVGAKNYYKISYGDYASKEGITERLFWPDDIEFIDIDGCVAVSFKSEPIKLLLSFNGDKDMMIVDSVLGNIPTDNADLAIKIADLKG